MNQCLLIFGRIPLKWQLDNYKIMIDHLAKYINRFINLRVDRSKGHPAPHKPLLVLSIMQEIEIGNISCNKIYITPELVARFKENFFRLIKLENFIANFSLPFYHLKSEGFWHFRFHDGKQLQLTSSSSIKSLRQLRDIIDYSYFDDELFLRLINIESRRVLKDCLVEMYFKGKIIKENSFNSYFHQTEELLLNEPSSVYKTEMNNLDEEEIFIRQGAFKRIVPKIYNHSCCISEMRIASNYEIQMIDACHIIPFSESHDDTITNGISLCPNLHRAFDRGLITIDNEYRILVSEKFSEDSLEYSIRKFDNKSMLLPFESKYYPSIKNLDWHRQNIFRH